MFKRIPELISRFVIGMIFLVSGVGKLQNLPKVTAFFESLNIPFATIQAPLVSGIEAVCGLLILIGLFTRLATIPLIIIMLVALITAKKEDITDFSTLLDQSEFLYLIILTWLAVYGAQILSIDYLRNKKLRRQKKAT